MFSSSSFNFIQSLWGDIKASTDQKGFTTISMLLGEVWCAKHCQGSTWNKTSKPPQNKTCPGKESLNKEISTVIARLVSQKRSSRNPTAVINPQLQCLTMLALATLKHYCYQPQEHLCKWISTVCSKKRWDAVGWAAAQSVLKWHFFLFCETTAGD